MSVNRLRKKLCRIQSDFCDEYSVCYACPAYQLAKCSKDYLCLFGVITEELE